MSKELKQAKKVRATYLANLITEYTVIQSEYSPLDEEYEKITKLIHAAQSELETLNSKKNAVGIRWGVILESVVGAAATAVVSGMILRHERDGYMTPNFMRDITSATFKRTGK